jgi:hypothetical protein
MIRIIALGAALALSTPAMAQSAGDDPADDAAFNNPNVMTVRNVTRIELAHGLQTFDAGGKPVGTVERLSGNDVIVASGTREITVPITDFFAYNQHGKDYFATRTPKAVLEAQSSTSRTKPLAFR